MTRTPVILIVGGGFAGSLTAVQLARQSSAPLHILLYDAAGAFARGVAYGTQEPSHLLNVRADRMGAFENEPEDFYRWLLAHEAIWRAKHPQLRDLSVTADGFMPRMLYGDYIESLLAEAGHHKNSVTIERISAEVTEATITSGGICVTLADGSTKQADRMVLALGNLLASTHGFEKAVAHDLRYTSKLWAPTQDSLLTRNAFTQADEPVLIIGTGLTMVDMLLSLRQKHYRGKVIAVSRHGLLPQSHAATTAYTRFLPAVSAPRTAFALFSTIRQEVKKAGTKNWRNVVDALRADTPALWAALSESERKKLIRVLAYWSVHRHRIPTSSAAHIAQEIKDGTLIIRAGHIMHIRAAGQQLEVDVRGKSGTETIKAAHVLNCAGPGLNIETSGNPLLLALYKRGIIRKGPLGMGIAVEENGSIKGSASGHLLALGPLLAGERLETIAVPEIRKQAEVLAKTLLSSLAPSA